MEIDVRTGAIVASAQADAISGNTAKKINIAEARENLTDLINEVAYGGQRLVVMRRGKELAALVPMADLVALGAIEIPMASGVMQDARFFTMTVSLGGGPAIASDEGGSTENP